MGPPRPIHLPRHALLKQNLQIISFFFCCKGLHPTKDNYSNKFLFEHISIYTFNCKIILKRAVCQLTHVLGIIANILKTVDLRNF